MRKALVFLLLFCWSCAPNLSPSYGRVPLKIDDQEIFFKREASGLSHDVTVISPRDDLCNIPNSKTDYVFRQQGPTTIFYKIENGALILFVSMAATPPESGDFPIKIVQNELDPLDLVKLKEAPAKDLKRLEVPFDDRLRCSD